MEPAERIAAAKKEIRGLWLRYVVFELVLVVLPVGVALVLWASEVVPGWLVVAAAVVGSLVLAGLAYDTALRKVRPLEREIAELESGTTA
jgi:membrane protein YdbS with pleckstrin-like domain